MQLSERLYVLEERLGVIAERLEETRKDVEANKRGLNELGRWRDLADGAAQAASKQTARLFVLAGLMVTVLNVAVTLTIGFVQGGVH